MPQTKLLSIIMPAFNAEQYIAEAISSILNQTFTGFELIIINDGSTDQTEKEIKKFKDDRIRYIKNQINLGLSPTLNKGLRLAKGRFVARMDADDISLPERLEKQINFLQSHPEYGVVGSMYLVLDERRQPLEIGGMDFRTDLEIKLSLLSNNVFLHGETMFRRDLTMDFKNPYDSHYNPCEDYELWVRISQKTKFYILEDILYKYMINPHSMSGTRWLEMKDMIKKIGRELQKKQGLKHFNLSTFIFFYKQGLIKSDQKILFERKLIPRYNKLNYQEFLFRTGLVYLKHLNLTGLIFLIVSFGINPFNWVRKFYRLIFIKHPRLKKPSQ